MSAAIGAGLAVIVVVSLPDGTVPLDEKIRLFGFGVGRRKTRRVARVDVLSSLIANIEQPTLANLAKLSIPGVVGATLSYTTYGALLVHLVLG